MVAANPSGTSVWRVALLVLLVAVSVMLIGGCSAERRYRVLSLFFDGVPDPNAPPGSRRGGYDENGNPNYRPVVYLHKPYAENRCDACHHNGTDQYTAVVEIDASICQTCHKTVTTQFPVMHGPVALGECLWCHTPHDSPYQHLLKMPSPRLCLQCHEPELLSSGVSAHQMRGADCLECHVGHGGAKHNLLRQVTVAAPATEATQPVTVPAARPGNPVVPAAPAPVAAPLPASPASVPAAPAPVDASPASLPSTPAPVRASPVPVATAPATPATSAPATGAGAHSTAPVGAAPAAREPQ